MAAITSAKIKEYQVIFTNTLDKCDNLTPSQKAMAKNPVAIAMLDQESAQNSNASEVTAYISWLQSYPKGMALLTAPSVTSTNFQTVINGTFTTAADSLPSTYLTLYNETAANAPALAGLLALRAVGVDSTYKDDGANLGAGTSGAVLSDANVMALYSSWGATKFNAIMNAGVLTAIKNESNTSYDTLAEVAALYSAWSGTVPVNSFFSGVSNLVSAGVTGLKFSDVMSVASNLTNFTLYTSPSVATLMSSSGGSWSTITGLSAGTLAALTSPGAIAAIKHGGATYTSLAAAYAADVNEFAALTSQDAVNLMMQGISGVNFAGLVTLYGGTPSVAATIRFNTLIKPEHQDLIKNGVTLAHLGAAYDAGKLKYFTDDMKACMAQDLAHYDTVFNDLVSVGSGNYAGFETIGIV